MTWNWKLKGWPHYAYDTQAVAHLEIDFLKASGIFLGIVKHLSIADQEDILITLLSDEAVNTSAIEGEFLNRNSLQASLKRTFGLSADNIHETPAEKGIAQMMHDVYRHYDEPLNANTLFSWHSLLMSGRSDLETIGAYRTHQEPMLIVSPSVREPTIHFEAPPSDRVPQLMHDFITWFNDSAPGSSTSLPALLRAAITHLYFESIHPFEDGNGRIGRALAEKALSQCLGQPSLICLSTEIAHNKKAYYEALKTTNHTLEISPWITYFAQTTRQAQTYTQLHIEFLINKTKFFDRFDSQLNERQRKVLLRMFREGPQGFKGGLNAEKYIKITGTSRATATRDLHDLLTLGALSKEGELRYSRYFLKFDFNSK